MARNASGTYTLVAGNPVTVGTVIESEWANNTMADLAASMTNSLARDGKGGMLAPLRGLAGSAGNPAISFTDFTSAGLYAFSATDVRMAIDGIDRMRWLASASVPQIWDVATAAWIDITATTVVVNPNKFLNADFGLFESDGATRITSGYAADQWCGNGVSPFSTTQQSTDGATANPWDYSLLLKTADIAMTGALMCQPLELPVIGLPGEYQTGTVWTVSGWVKTAIARTLNISAEFSDDAVVPANTVALDTQAVAVTGGGVWEQFNATLTLTGVPVGTNTCMRVEFSVASLEDGDEFFFANLKFETGAANTAFRTNSGSVGGELTVCERYYQRLFTDAPVGTVVGFGQVLSTTGANIDIPLRTSMLKPPDLDFSTASHFSLTTAAGASSGSASAITVTSTTTENSVQVSATTPAATLVAGNATSLYVVSVANIADFGLSARL